jgi:ATP-dependent DNA helicase RecQ
MPKTANSPKRLPDFHRVAREKFGYHSLRPGQAEVIRLVLQGHDVLSIMPTGSGKSAIYQICALLIGGPTVVVSPLIALQKDQVESIQEQDLAPAAVVNSTITAGERREAFEKLGEGELEFLFLAPEQLANEETFKKVLENKPSLFVVDEAHCVSEWGHDFRPDYIRLGAIIEALGHPRVLALTATASDRVRQDIAQRLNMDDPKTIVWGFDRPNIHLAVESCPDDEAKERVLLGKVQEWKGPGIIYVATRKNAGKIALLLRENNVKSTAYHAGLKAEERRRIQDEFMADDTGVMVATNAFGMGVDKPDVRFVIHYDIPESLDAYYQEVGRAGRDGAPARALLLYRSADVGRRRAMAQQGKLDEDDVEEIVEVIAHAKGPVDADTIAEETELSSAKVAKAINRLEETGAVKTNGNGEVKAASRRIDVGEAAQAAVDEQNNFRQQRLGRVEIMQDYAQTGDCRRRYILNYFGEKLDRACGHCDNCELGVVEEEKRQEEKLPYPLKSRVVHEKLGVGTVMRYEEDKVVVLFEEAGYKSLVAKYCLERGLLKLQS